MAPLWFNPIDPFGSIKDQLLDLYKSMTDLFQRVFIDPPRVSNSTVFSGLYEESMNLAIYLSYILLVAVIVIAALAFRKIERVGKAFFIFLVLATLGPLWLWFVNQLILLGNDWAQLMNFYDPPESSSAGEANILPGVSNDIGHIVGLGLALMAGSVLAGFIMTFDFFIIMFKFWGPIAFSISSFGKRAAQFSNIILSLGLVAAVFGRPFAVFFLEMGQVAVFTFPFGTTVFGAFVYTIGSYAIAGLSQLILIAACYKGIASVEGWIMSKTKGAVDATIKNIAKVDINKSNKNHTAGLKPTPVVIVDTNKKNYIKQEGAHVARNAASQAANKVAAASAAAGHPWVGAGVKYAGGKVKKSP